MKKFYSNLKGSIKLYLWGLLSGLIGLLYINPLLYETSPITPVMRLVAFANLGFAAFKIVSIILLICGVYQSYKELRGPKSDTHKELENKAWFRFAKIAWFVAYFALLIYLVGTYVSEKTGFISVFLYIFAMRLLAQAFYYVVLGNKTKTL